jgi:aspartyl-tRNA(Asn)/glutamyl-tRNA(Gln) amidotransferase subunit A
VWAEHAEPLVAQRVAEAAERFPHARRLEVPLPKGLMEAFMREAGDVHRELFEEHADEYSDNVRAKLERCLAVTDAEYERAAAARERYRDRLLELTAGVDLLLSPTLVCVAPRTGQDELALRGTLTRLTFPFNATGWPALALPCGAAEDGLPASVQLAAPPGEDARVLAAGAALESALSLG